MSIEENKAIARRLFEEGFNGHNPAVADELFSSDFVQHVTTPGASGDREGVKQAIAMIFAAFPDFHLTVDDMVAEGDRVVARYTAHATHQGELMGIPATGKPVTITVIDIFRLADGRIAEHWVEANQLELMQQLGVIPAPGQAPGQ